jgi:hypothetical protein
MLRRTRTIVVLAAMAALTVGGAAYASDGAPQHGWFGFGGHHHGAFHHGHGSFDKNVTAGSITAVGESSLTLKTRDGSSVTVKTDGDTRVFVAGKPGALSDLETGWLAFVVKGSDGVADYVRAASKAVVEQGIKQRQAQMHAWQANHHFAAGKITAVGTDSLTLTGRDGTPVTVKVDASTKVFAGHKQVALSSLKTGWFAFAGEGSDDVADVIRAASPDALRHDWGRHDHHDGRHHDLHGDHVAAGKITAVGDGTLTLAGRDGKAETVKVDGHTQVFAGHERAQLSDLKTGWFAFAVEGKNGVAQVVHAVDPSTLPWHQGGEHDGGDTGHGGDGGVPPDGAASGSA